METRDNGFGFLNIQKLSKLRIVWLCSFIFAIITNSCRTSVVEIVYFTELYATENMNDSLLKSPLIWKATNRKDFWRWFTYSFCHGSILHLVLNLICKILLGIFVEFEHKWVRTLIIYVLGEGLR